MVVGKNKMVNTLKWILLAHKHKKMKRKQKLTRRETIDAGGILFLL